MAITREKRIVYLARNAQTGLTDVTAQIRRNGVYVLGTDTTPLPLTEIGSGRYELVLSAAQLNTAGGAGFFDFYINSATKNAPGIFGEYITENNEDDLESHLTTIEGKVDNVEAKVDVIDGNVDSIKVTVEDNNAVLRSASYGNEEIKNVVDAVQTAIGQIQNNTRFVTTMPVEMVIPTLGVKAYRVWIGLYDTAGNLEDPDSNQITVTLENDQGVSRNDYLKDSVAGAAVDATRDSLGVYFIDLEIPDTAAKEQLISKFAYDENTTSLIQIRTSNLISEVDASGLALEATSQSIKTTVDTMGPQVADIQTKINDASIGLAAIRNAITAVQSVVDDTNSELGNGTYGLSALKTLIDTKSSQASVDAIDTKIDDDVKGSGFDQAEDTLAQISNRTFFGGHTA